MNKVFIILVNYNGCDDTLACIESLKKIDYEDYSIVVVDNNSSDADETEGKIKELWSDIIFIRSKENLGFAGGNNLGIQYALKNSADFVLLLNNDTVVERDFLTVLVNVALKKPDAGIITGRIFSYYSGELCFAGGEMDLNKAKTKHLTSKVYALNTSETKEISFVTGCLMLIPKNVIQTIGMLEESYFMYSEDVDYCCRVAQKGLKMIYTPKAVIYHKVGASSGGKGSSLSQYYRTRNDLIIIRKYAEKKPLAYFFYCLRLIKRNLIGQFQPRYTISGIKAYLRNEKGRALKI